MGYARRLAYANPIEVIQIESGTPCQERSCARDLKVEGSGGEK